ncbi:hypothetical protein ACLKA6_018648 [Drosophila palustris]
MKKNLGRKSKTPTPILTPTPPPFLTPTSAPKSSQKEPNAPANGRADDKDEEEKDAIAAINYSNNSVDEPSDDVVDVVAISSATSFAESTSSSAGNISPVVSSFGIDFVDTLIEEEDATSSSSSAATITRNPSPIMPNEEQQQQQHKSNLAATAATTIILPGAVIANTPSGAAAAAASSNSNKKDPVKILTLTCTRRDDPEYDKSDPDVTLADLSDRCTTSSSLDDSWQSTSEDEIIGDVSMMDHDDDDVDNLVAAKVITTTATIHSSGDMPVYVSKAATTTTTTTTAATTTTTSSSSSGSNGSNNNNNNTTTQATTKSMFKKEANAKSFKDLENFFNEQNVVSEAHQQTLKDQQKWNLVKSKKIPTLFLPRVEKIQPLLDRLNSIDGVANKYTTKCIQNGAIRLHCKDMDTYTIISAELRKDNMELHTHQLRKNRGFRIVIRHLHSTTDNQWIRDQLMPRDFSQYSYVQQQQHQEQPDNSLRLALLLNHETIALMGKKMDAMLESIKVLLSNLITNNNTPHAAVVQLNNVIFT